MPDARLEGQSSTNADSPPAPPPDTFKEAFGDGNPQDAAELFILPDEAPGQAGQGKSVSAESPPPPADSASSTVSTNLPTCDAGVQTPSRPGSSLPQPLSTQQPTSDSGIQTPSRPGSSLHQPFAAQQPTSDLGIQTPSRPGSSLPETAQSSRVMLGSLTKPSFQFDNILKKRQEPRPHTPILKRQVSQSTIEAATFSRPLVLPGVLSSELSKARSIHAEGDHVRACKVLKAALDAATSDIQHVPEADHRQMVVTLKSVRDQLIKFVEHLELKGAAM